MAVREHALFRRLDTPAEDAAKGGCYIWGGTGPCIDTGVLVEFEGNLTIGLGALREMAEVAGWSVCEEGEQLEREHAALTAENARLASEVADLTDQLTAVGVAVARAAAERNKS